MVFGLKKGEKKKKPEKPDKSKRKSSSSGGGGLNNAKTWLIHNVEKLVLGLIVLVSGYIVYSGFSREGLPDANSPDDLKRTISSAQSSIKSGDWEKVKGTRYPEEDRFVEQATQDTIDVNLAHYPMPKPFFPLLKKREKLRTDPQILMAQDLEVRAAYGPLALKGSTSELSGFDRNREGTRSIPEPLNRRFSRTVAGEAVKSVYFTIVMGIIPVKQQLELYNEAFIGAAEYDRDRDTPDYVGLKIERRLVDNGSAGQWEEIKAMEVLQTEPATWASTADDPVASKYVADYVQSVVMPVPPIVGKDLTNEIMHSKVETQKEVDEQERLEMQQEQQADRVARGPIGEGRREGRIRSSGPDADLSTTELAPEEEAMRTLNADVAMFRFFDFNVEPGKRYEYRVKLLVDDPNNPSSLRERKRPTENACESSVLVRRMAPVKEGELEGVRESEWSQPSPAVAVPQGGFALVGGATSAKTAGRTAIRAINDEPEATVLAVGWDRAKSMEVPVEVEAYRGTVLNSTGDVEAVDPKAGVITKLENYTSRTDAMVLDITGGDKLDYRGELRSPGMILVMTPSGKIEIRREISDEEQYELTAIPPDEELLRELERKKEEEKAKKERRDRGERGERGPFEGVR